MSKLVPVRHARVPILKITTSGGVSVDISIAGMSGPKAAEFIRQQVGGWGPDYSGLDCGRGPRACNEGAVKCPALHDVHNAGCGFRVIRKSCQLCESGPSRTWAPKNVTLVVKRRRSGIRLADKIDSVRRTE